MAAFWLAAIPSGIWATQAIGNTINETVFRQKRAEPPNVLLDHEGALACAKAALNIHPISPTALHLRELVKQSANRLVKLVETTKLRVEKHSWSRIFRDPDFSYENKVTQAEIHTLKSRVSLFLSVMQVFPQKIQYDSFEKSLPADHKSIDSDEESEDSESSSSNCVTDSMGSSVDSSTENLQPLEMSFWQTLLTKAVSSSSLGGPYHTGDEDGDEDTGSA